MKKKEPKLYDSYQHGDGVFIAVSPETKHIVIFRDKRFIKIFLP
jgi:hypothetical protein